MFDKTKFLSIQDDATPLPSVEAWAARCVCIAGLKGQSYCTCKANERAIYADSNGTTHVGDHLAAPQTFDGEKGTYSDPQCSTCPWVSLDDDHLERIHSAWLAMSPQGREECARYYAEACAASMQAQFEAESESFWMRQGRHH